MYRFIYTLIFLLVSIGLLVGCDSALISDKPQDNADAEEIVFTLDGSSSLNPAELNSQIAELRRATAPYQRFESAREDGYTTKITKCMSSPEGGMGFHYAKTDLIDASAVVDEPESLLYEPEPNGRFRLVGVEYIVPFEEWTESEPPTLYGRHFHANNDFGIWALHVWAWRHNPNGLFADWNPKVTC